MKNEIRKMLIAASLTTGFSAMTVLGAENLPILEADSNIYGEIYTNGYTTVKAEDGLAIDFSDTSAVFRLKFEDGTEVDNSLIDASEAFISLDEGDGYLTTDYIFTGTGLEDAFEEGQAVYTLKSEDLTWTNDTYPVDNGGKEWSAIGGNGNGHYVFNLSLNGVKYDGQEVEPASFRAEIYVYGREFSSRNSPQKSEENDKGANGYDDMVIPEAKFAKLAQKPEVADDPVWTWVGDGEKPILCDYLADDFYISWPEHMDASAVSAEDVTITMRSRYGDEYILDGGEFAVQSAADETQIAVTMVYWPYAPVYTTMELTVAPEHVEGLEEEISNTYDIASVYVYQTQMGGGMDRDLTVTCNEFFGVEKIDSVDQVYTDAQYFYGYKEEGAGHRDPYKYVLVDDGNGGYTVSTDEKEATMYDANGEEEQNIRLIGNTVYRTNHTDQIEMEWDGEQITFTKSYRGGQCAAPAADLAAAPGYVMTDREQWDNHQRWGWLYINNQGWMNPDAGDEGQQEGH